MDDDTISRRMVLTILEGMAEQNDSAPRPESAEVFGLRKGIRMAIGTAMDRIKAMPGANETRDDVNRLMATPDAEMDNELRRLGIDPAEAERQGKAAVEGALETIRARNAGVKGLDRG